MIHEAVVSSESASLRLDDGLKELFPQYSKTELRRVIDWGGCTIDGICTRVASRPLRAGEKIQLGVMEKERCVDLVYTKNDLLYEDEEYLSICKASGINSQRTPYQLKGTAEYAVSAYLKSIGSHEPARVIHRLDRGTSGVMFFPKNKKSATHISYLLKTGDVEKIYWAIVTDITEEKEWIVDKPIAKICKFRYGTALPGKEALTRFRVLAEGTKAALIEARPETGRTHQIRVHLELSGLHILGDTVYGGVPAERVMLHCRNMSFKSRTEKSIKASAPVDDLFRKACESLSIDIASVEQENLT